MIPTIEDILRGLQTGNYSLEQGIHWVEIHLNDQRSEQQYHDQEQRRRVFVEVALANDKATMSWIAEKAEAILSESERFATKEPKND